MASKTKLQLHEESDHITHKELRDGIDAVINRVDALATRVNVGIGILTAITFLAANGMLNLSSFTQSQQAQAADVARAEAR
jgi:hypothetical protein